jgi:hypothetical protein
MPDNVVPLASKIYRTALKIYRTTYRASDTGSKFLRVTSQSLEIPRAIEARSHDKSSRQPRLSSRIGRSTVGTTFAQGRGRRQ